MLKKSKRTISLVLVLALMLTMIPAMLVSAVAGPSLHANVCVTDFVGRCPCILDGGAGGYLASDGWRDGLEHFVGWNNVNPANPAEFIQFVAYDNQKLVTEYASFTWDGIRAFDGRTQQRSFKGEVAVIEVDSIAAIYRGDMDIFGGFRVFNRFELGQPGWTGLPGPNDVYFESDALLEIIAPGAAHNQGAGKPGLIGIWHSFWTSELVFNAMDPWDKNVRNPIAVGGQPYFNRTGSAPIYVRFVFDYLGIEYEMMFKIIQKPVGPTSATVAGRALNRQNIVAFLNGFSIPSLNTRKDPDDPSTAITVVSEFDLPRYGFRLVWDGVRQRLNLMYVGSTILAASTTDDDRDRDRALVRSAMNGPLATVNQTTRVELRTAAGGWTELEAYQVGGEMFFNIEDLGIAEWISARREIRVNSQALNCLCACGECNCARLPKGFTTGNCPSYSWNGGCGCRDIVKK